MFVDEKMKELVRIHNELKELCDPIKRIKKITHGKRKDTGLHIKINK